DAVAATAATAQVISAARTTTRRSMRQDAGLPREPRSAEVLPLAEASRNESRNENPHTTDQFAGSAPYGHRGWATRSALNVCGPSPNVTTVSASRPRDFTSSTFTPSGSVSTLGCGTGPVTVWGAVALRDVVDVPGRDRFGDSLRAGAP